MFSTPTKILLEFLIASMRATFPAALILLTYSEHSFALVLEMESSQFMFEMLCSVTTYEPVRTIINQVK